MEVPFLEQKAKAFSGGMALIVPGPKEKHFISCQANLHPLHELLNSFRFTGPT